MYLWGLDLLGGRGIARLLGDYCVCLCEDSQSSWVLGTVMAAG